ncbi:uncharacterized protein BX663DRAFT_458114, partial [Cokeromyces recurvatus]|uniref:uncharacterized protein n=1 Tax=Cokeromyces recurvatus TaxID=90255 RepID=UPI002220BB5C
SSFSYLDVSFKIGRFIDSLQLVFFFKDVKTFNQLSVIGVNPKGFSRILASHLYAQIIRPQLEYDYSH